MSMRQLKISRSITIRESHSLEKYLQEIGKVSLLTPEEEESITKKIKHGDKEALQQLTMANLRFVVSVAKQYQNLGLSLSDLINEGNLGLITAASRYDESKGFKFISYAVWWIRQAILQALAEDSRLVRLPLNKVSLKNKIIREYNVLEQKFEREPSVAELAQHLRLKRNVVEDILSAASRPRSIDAPILEDGEGTLIDVLVNANAPKTDSGLAHDESLSKDIVRSLKTLTSRQRDIVKLYFGIDEEQPYSLEDIALKYDLSRERVRQIKDKAIESLKNNAHLDLLRSYL
jgi:RNA polymerase primary sigma factor